MTTPTTFSRCSRFAERGLPIAVLMALAACGGGGDDSSGSSAAPAPAPVPAPTPAPAPAPAPTPAPAPAPTPTSLRTSLNAPGASGGIEARTSQAPTTAGAEPSTVFDDFRIGSAATIARISWQGIYCVQANGSAAPAPTASQFVIAIHPDVGGRPNLAAPLLQTTVTVAAAGQTFERNVANVTCGSAVNTNWALYDYSVALPAPVAVAANTTYWVSVQAVTPSYDVYWGWRAGTADNNLSLIRFQGTYTTFNLDRAYALLP